VLLRDVLRSLGDRGQQLVREPFHVFDMTAVS
jgi:hypothetical protein